MGVGGLGSQGVAVCHFTFFGDRQVRVVGCMDVMMDGSVIHATNNPHLPWPKNSPMSVLPSTPCTWPISWAAALMGNLWALNACAADVSVFCGLTSVNMAVVAAISFPCSSMHVAPRIDGLVRTWHSPLVAFSCVVSNLIWLHQHNVGVQLCLVLRLPLVVLPVCTTPTMQCMMQCCNQTYASLRSIPIVLLSCCTAVLQVAALGVLVGGTLGLCFYTGYRVYFESPADSV